jgi:Flp pilus assembly protein TadD/SAM-dependent methyltransferase
MAGEPDKRFAHEDIFQQAATLHEQGRLDRAERLYRAILDADSADIGSLHNLGILCVQQGRYGEGAKLASETLRQKPDLAPAHNTLGVALRHLGRLTEAESCCREALRLIPTYADAHNSLGDTLIALGRFTEAEAHCREALRLVPTYAEAHNNLAAALLSLGRPHEAEICCREALRLKPGNATALNNLGTVLLALGRPEEAEMYCLRYLKNIFGNRYKPHSSGPLPPAELITTEALMRKDDLKLRARPEWYFSGGFRDARTVLTMLETSAFDLRSMQSVLEFGCGSGRVLRHFRNITGLRLAGTDANPKAIAWDCVHLPGIDFSENALTPPLKYDDASFDLVYALSVFTHITVEMQQPWLNELRRVLRPGGYLLCTVHGNNYVNSQLNEQDRVQLERDGALTLDRSHPRVSYSSQVLGSWDVFQTRGQVRAAFSTGFEILCYTATPAAAGQDTLVLRALR